MLTNGDKLYNKIDYTSTYVYTKLSNNITSIVPTKWR